MQKERKAANNKKQQIVPMVSPSGIQGGTSIPAASARLPTRSLCCESGYKTTILYQGSFLRRQRGTRKLKLARQLHGASRDLSLSLAGGRTNLFGPRRTKSRRSNRNVLDTPLVYNIGNSHPWS